MAMPKLTYEEAGVNVQEGQRAVNLMKESVKSTFTKGVLGDIGGFGGLFALDPREMEKPILVAGTDGVGTKLKLAFMMNRHDTIGEDCVAMCVNDILCQGAKPLFFLDYIATGKLKAEVVAEIVQGIANGCKKAGCALIGGETAEMPGFYQKGEYDVAGFTVGMVEEKNLITGKEISQGDIMIGISSSGVHSNGFSLVRKLFFEDKQYSVDQYVDGLGETLGEALLRPTKIYVKPILEVLQQEKIKGMVHVTGGGFYENIPRILPEGIDANVHLDTWQAPPIFQFIQQEGQIEQDEMFSTFNMGIGMIVVVERSAGEKVVQLLQELGEEASIIGEMVRGSKQVVLCQK
ncbi:phosphoribosylformylglycinamidine cyclo-ligase [Alkaliphilus metalliredigens QYMF]|uniref:Phosphoribosylformylglycinamidine cyclo-ligase n=1 Tax=Alkaliphilus metalliredigens (strain QYMF) TaxID=293826 RepID=PUR5_ALKMQ|nr:RecName: Full=Phosphoribosylformylglycinamidine cyclo-ligase; AltName: Full=AIR synthase; AltName: Full=AIRS; AltName: Full=Phosphoribosyl-aminoimidazole synthetase [Alkaliphilus metalliredigens QYMF]ABR47143.1 phosphoribosylformylglycinamidine cyclo-ligase [Alkaliphilus metalliredigens QYMF]